MGPTLVCARVTECLRLEDRTNIVAVTRITTSFLISRSLLDYCLPYAPLRVATSVIQRTNLSLRIRSRRGGVRVKATWSPSNEGAREYRETGQKAGIVPAFCLVGPIRRGR